MTPQQQEALNRMWEYLFSQGIYGSYQFPTYDSTYMGDLYNLYEDLQIRDPNMYYDSVFPKYEQEILAGNPRAKTMAEYFVLIDQGISPDDIINRPEELEIMTGTEKDDLRKYASEKATRDEAAAKQQMEMIDKAKMYGLPDPTLAFNVPPEMVRELIKTKEGLTPEQTSRRELATTRMVERAAIQQSAKNRTAGKISTDPVIARFENRLGQMSDLEKRIAQREALVIANGDDPNKDVPLANMRRQLANKPKIASRIQERSTALQDAGMDVGRQEVKKPTVASAPATKVGGAVGARVKVLERMAQADADNEQALIQELANQLMQRFGTPFDRALKEAAQIAASRKKGASGNWLA